MVVSLLLRKRKIQATAPVNTVAPAITGTNGVGNVQTCSTGTWTGTATITYAYQWKVAGINVGTNTNTYTPVTNDAGKALTCVVTATNPGGSVTATSNTVNIPAIAPANTVAPAITGTLGVGNVLTCSTGTWTGTATITYARQWKSNGVNVGTNSANYTPVSGDAEHNITCVVSATNAAGTVTATSNSVAIPAEGLTNLLTDTTTRTMTTTARPAYLTPFADPVFGPIITRISGDPGTGMTGLSGRVWGSDVRPLYMRHSAWNIDESLIYLEYNDGDGGSSGGTWLDGETYAPVYSRSRPASWVDGRWSGTDANTMIYITSTQMRSLNVSANTTALIHDFSSLYDSMMIGNYEGEPSRDTDVWPITARRISDDTIVCFAYKISTNTVSAVVVPNAYKAYGDGGNQITPDGTHMCIWFDDETFRTYRISDGALIYTSSVLQQPSHYAMAIDTNGTSQMAVGSERAATGNMVKVNALTGAVTTINNQSYAYHTTAANHQGANANKWIATDHWHDSGVPYVNEIVIVAMDGTVTGRICHMHRNTTIDYKTEPHPVLSPTGKRVLWNTTWDASGTTPVGVYCADFRGFQLPGIG